MSSLLEPTTLGDSLDLRNRICMGSMTRNRCVDDNKPTEATARHYAMRARDGAGLIIAEGTFVYLNGGEWLHAPVMFNESHAKAWKPVTDAVHREGGKILFQPWHPGRIQNENMPMLRNSGYPVLAPSKIKAAGGKYRLLDGIPGHTSNITEIKDPNEIIDQYKTSVRLAKDAGFDGVEILAQGGYVLHNFLCTHANSRTDKYGGSVENRCRFVLEVLDGVIEAWGSPRQVGIKICPSDDANDTTVSYDELSSTYDCLIRQMMTRRLGFINLSRRGAAFARLQDDFFKAGARPAGKELPPGYDPVEQFGHLVKYPGSPTMLMVNYEYTVEEGEELVRAGKVDLISFARPFIYNPDLISRIKQGLKLATNNRGGTVNYGPYAHVDENYNDWPSATGEVVKA